MPACSSAKTIVVAENAYIAVVNLRHGDVVMKREVWGGTPHLVYPIRVVEDAGDSLTLYLASGTPSAHRRGAGRGRTRTHGREKAAGGAMASSRY